jgi:hypothetical protein
LNQVRRGLEEQREFAAMSLHLANTLDARLGPERKLKNRITVRLVEPHEQARFEAILTAEHYLCNPTAVGAVLQRQQMAGGYFLRSNSVGQVQLSP